MTKKFKQIGFALGSLALIGVPFATTISCGSNSAKTITFGVRAEEASFYSDAIKQFEKATGYTIKLKMISDQVNNYTMWGTSLTPDVTLTDANAMKVGHEKGWFKPLDLKDLFENENYMLDNSKLDIKYQEKQLKFDDTDFNIDMLNCAKIDASNYYGMPFIYGPKLLYAWKNLNGKDLIQDKDDAVSTKPLKWYVPKTAGGLEEAKFTGTTHETNPLLDKNDTPYTTSYEDIQQFIFDAADSTELDLNFGGKTPTEALRSSNASDHVIATGAYGQRQRIASIGKSINEDNGLGIAAAASDAALNYAGILQGESGYKNGGTSFQDATSGALDDSKWLANFKESWDPASNKINGTTTVTDANNSGDQMAVSYFGNIGYFAAGDNGLITTTQAGKADQLSVFSDAKSLFLEGAKWQQSGIISNIVDKQHNKDDVTAFAIPFFESGIDGYSLNNKLSGEKETAAKQFMRFLMQAQVSATAASDKTLAIRNEGKSLQMAQQGESPFTMAVTKGGRPDASLISAPLSTQYVVNKLSTLNLFDVYNEKMLKDTWDGVLQGNPKAISFEEYAKHLQIISQDLKTTDSLS